jgi:hypothetical protein
LPIYGTRFAGATLSRLRVIQTGDLPVGTESEANETAATISRPGEDAPGTFFRSVPPSGRWRTRDENASCRLIRPLTLDRGQGCGYIS